MNITERFLTYARMGTQSDPSTGTHPSTPAQLELGRYLVEELSGLGLEQPHMDEHGYVYAWLPASEGMEQVPTLGLIAHMDTADAVPADPVRPAIVRFDGAPIRLNDKVTLTPNPRYIGQDLIVTDGTTLLGADDKAGVAEIVSAVEYLVNHPEVKHGRVAIGFTPDEEIGEGADLFDVEKFGARTAYTLDGGELGEIEYENFNAASCAVIVNGVNTHPGSAKNVMKNAILMGAEFMGLLPAAEIPACTEGYEGFFHVNSISGDENCTRLHYIVRDHDMEKFEARKALLVSAAQFMNAKYGEGTVELVLKDSYRNMKEQILPHMELIENAKTAMTDCGVEPQVVAIRGGTDGARLSFMGLPCPNLCTGGANYHSLTEYVPVSALEKMTEITVRLITLQG